MNDGLQITVSFVALVVAAVALVYVDRDRRAERLLLAAIGVLWLATLVQLVYGIVRLPDADDDVHKTVFVLYLLGLAALPPAAAWWARGEPSRAGSGVVVAAGLLIPVLLLRLGTLWSGGA